MNHWQTIENELEERKLQVEMALRDKSMIVPSLRPRWEQRLRHIDAALAFVREMRQGVQPLDAPDGPGWWAWQEEVERGVSEIYMGSRGELIASDEPGGLTVDYFSGRKWWRLHMPWD